MKICIKKHLPLPLLMAGFVSALTIPASPQAFKTLHSFTTFNGTNTDGANPSAGLILAGHTLYGTAEYGGSSGDGGVFGVNIDGTGFGLLHTFTTRLSNGGFFANSDGA